MKKNAMEKAQQIKEARSQSVPRSVGSGRIREGRPPPLPIRKPERVDSEELNKNVAAKLQPLEAVTKSILAGVEERKPSGTPLHKATCKDFTVGRASCSASSVVTLFPDRLEYKFSHSSQGRIDMIMYAKDMVSPELDARTLVLKFRVGKPLRHFIDAYDCTDPSHTLQLTFHDKADAAAFAQWLPGSCKVALQVVGGSL